MFEKGKHTVITIVGLCIRRHFHILMRRETFSAQVASGISLAHLVDHVSFDVVDHVLSNITGQPYIFLKTARQSLATLITRRTPNSRHVSRTQRDDLDWLFERINVYHLSSICYAGTTG